MRLRFSGPIERASTLAQHNCPACWLLEPGGRWIEHPDIVKFASDCDRVHARIAVNDRNSRLAALTLQHKRLLTRIGEKARYVSVPGRHCPSDKMRHRICIGKQAAFPRVKSCQTSMSEFARSFQLTAQEQISFSHGTFDAFFGPLWVKTTSIAPASRAHSLAPANLSLPPSPPSTNPWR